MLNSCRICQDNPCERKICKRKLYKIDHCFWENNCPAIILCNLSWGDHNCKEFRKGIEDLVNGKRE